MGWGNKNYDGPKYLGLSGLALSRAIGFAASAGFLLFGYDQGVLGSLLTLPSFTEVFPEIDTQGKSATSNEATLQGLTVGLYEIGCFMGAISCLWLGDWLGRRKIIIIGTVIMIIGAVIQAASFGVVQLIIARIITGVGNGMHTATIPMWQSECSPPHKRGMLVMVEGLLITGGICMAYWIDFAFYWVDPASRMAEGTYNPTDYPHRSAAWRIPIAWQILLCIPTFATYWCPESPRWLMLVGRQDEARRVIASLDEVAMDDPEVDAKLKEISISLNIAQRNGVSDVFKQGPEHNFHRVTLGFVNQMFQQICGINLITYYAPTILQTNIGLSALLSRIIGACNGTEYFLASFIAIWTIEKFGRRKLMLFGSVGQTICMILLSICTAPSITKPDATGNATNKGPTYAAVVWLFGFNTFFAIGWLGMTWLYPAEITPLAIRAAANGISTSSNWLWNFLVVLITPIAFANIGHNTYTIFAVLNFAILITTFFIFPETAGRSLEEMSSIFEKSSYINPFDVVRKEWHTPRRYDTKGNLIADILGESENGYGGGRDAEKTETTEVKQENGSNNNGSIRSGSE